MRRPYDLMVNVASRITVRLAPLHTVSRTTHVANQCAITILLSLINSSHSTLYSHFVIVTRRTTRITESLSPIKDNLSSFCFRVLSQLSDGIARNWHICVLTCLLGLFSTFDTFDHDHVPLYDVVHINVLFFCHRFLFHWMLKDVLTSSVSWRYAVDLIM